MRTWLEINYEQIEKNLNTVSSVLPENCEIIAVVKANAYGHGDIEVTKMLEKFGVKYFAVACISEAIALRTAGVQGEILVLGYTDVYDAKTAAFLNITLTATSPEHLKELCRYMDVESYITEGEPEPNIDPLKVHLAVNTGMNRLGFDCKTEEQLKEIADAYRTYSDTMSGSAPIKVTGIFSHFSSADDLSEGAEPYTLRQLDRFENVLAYLKKHGIDPGVAHISNSGGIGKYPNARFDAVRCGALLYGYNTAMDAKLPVQPAMQWKTIVTCIRTIEEGDAVSYSRKFIANGPRTIATLGTGYADGLSRQLSNRGYVLINGMRAPIVGNICMDQMMVDITEIQLQAHAGRADAVTLGTEAVIIGRSGELIQTADDIAEWQGSCMHEVLSTIGKRVERFHNKKGFGISESIFL